MSLCVCVCVCVCECGGGGGGGRGRDLRRGDLWNTETLHYMFEATYQRHYSKSSVSAHTQDACVFSCNLPPALLAEWQGSFTCYCSLTRRWSGYRNKSRHRKLTLEKNIHPLLPGIELWSRVRRSTTELSPPPYTSWSSKGVSQHWTNEALKPCCCFKYEFLFIPWFSTTNGECIVNMKNKTCIPNYDIMHWTIIANNKHTQTGS